MLHVRETALPRPSVVQASLPDAEFGPVTCAHQPVRTAAGYSAEAN
jgi:hypothetical protein